VPEARVTIEFLSEPIPEEKPVDPFALVPPGGKR
jgi:hypothetical protein